jgi:hypothetical protein
MNNADKAVKLGLSLQFLVFFTDKCLAAKKEWLDCPV